MYIQYTESTYVGMGLELYVYVQYKELTLRKGDFPRTRYSHIIGFYQTVGDKLHQSSHEQDHKRSYHLAQQDCPRLVLQSEIHHKLQERIGA